MAMGRTRREPPAGPSSYRRLSGVMTSVRAARCGGVAYPSLTAASAASSFASIVVVAVGAYLHMYIDRGPRSFEMTEW